MSLKGYLDFVCHAQSLDILWDGHVAQMKKFGFDRLIYGNTRCLTETSLGDPDDFVLLTNHDEDYLQGYLHTGLYLHAPMLRWALDNEGAGSWRIAQEQARDYSLSPEAQKVVDFNRTHGVQSGYTISFPSTNSRFKGAISLAAEADMSQDMVDAIWQDHGADILLMNNVVHLKILTLPYAGPKRTLTKRQREVLEWVGDGKTTQDIALLMGLTPATIEKHLRLARESLAVETTAQAVLKAALHNQMYLIDA